MRLARITLFILSCTACIITACGPQPLVLSRTSGDDIPVLPTVTPETTTAFFRPIVTPTPIALASDEPVVAVLDPVEVGSVGADTALGVHMRNLEDSGLFSGSVLVARRGEILLRHGYGMAHPNERNTATTRFRIASLTKQFTAALILKLHERGRLNIDDGICNYIELCPATWGQVTIRHLLSHTSGIPDYTEFRSFDPTQNQPTTRDELIARFRDEPLIFTPGGAYRYSNSGYVLLGSILEYVTGMPYDQILRSEITEPLGLNNTAYDRSVNGSDPLLAQGLAQPGVPADTIDSSTLDTAGALYSTVDDLFRWDRALSDGLVLRPETLALMRTPQLKNYGLGVMLNPLANMRSVHHDGMASGTRTYLGNFVDDDICVIVLSNYERADVVGIAIYMAQLAQSIPTNN
jgi:CubicO group peptidase (beta-lactamase class C family)